MLDLKPPKLYINGFPKSGLHLAERMTRPLFEPYNKDWVWYGTNPWTLEHLALEKCVDIFTAVNDGEYVKGHTGYMAEIDQLLDALQFIMVLVYRDLRDVVVSQAYHIMDDMDGALNHPGREDYDCMTKHEIMLAVINGHGRWAGIFDRWKQYERWFTVPYVYRVRYEDMLHKPERTAKLFFEWVYSVSIGKSGEPEAVIDKVTKQDVINYIVNEMKQRNSDTYRKGNTGDWKREFTPEIVKAFKAADKTNALYRLGYVKGKNW